MCICPACINDVLAHFGKVEGVRKEYSLYAYKKAENYGLFLTCFQ